MEKEKEAARKKLEEERLSRMKMTVNVRNSKHESADALGDEYVIYCLSYYRILTIILLRFVIDNNNANIPTLVYPMIEDDLNPEEVKVFILIFFAST